jgi:serine phosphatase RsbU (regulator of sigma subunit)
MFTDGLSEARDSSGDFFSVSSLDDVLRSSSIQRAAEGSVVAVSEHVPRGRLKDDLAVVVTPNRSASTSAAAPAGIRSV